MNRRSVRPAGVDEGAGLVERRSGAAASGRAAGAGRRRARRGGARARLRRRARRPVPPAPLVVPARSAAMARRDRVVGGSVVGERRAGGPSGRRRARQSTSSTSLQANAGDRSAATTATSSAGSSTAVRIESRSRTASVAPHERVALDPVRDVGGVEGALDAGRAARGWAAARDVVRSGAGGRPVGGGDRRSATLALTVGERGDLGGLAARTSATADAATSPRRRPSGPASRPRAA